VTSTDFIRETMRAFLPREVMPSVHFSSFEAEESVTDPETGDPTIDGFLDQTRNVLVGVDAAIERALTEGWSMVLEGVHLVPGMVRSRIEGALVVHVVLHIENEDVHRLNFQVRDAATGGVRPMERYLSRLGDIRRIQDFLVARSEANGVPVLEGTNPERATAEVMELVLSTAGRLEPVR